MLSWYLFFFRRWLVLIKIFRQNLYLLLGRFWFIKVSNQNMNRLCLRNFSPEADYHIYNPRKGYTGSGENPVFRTNIQINFSTNLLIYSAKYKFGHCILLNSFKMLRLFSFDQPTALKRPEQTVPQIRQ